MNKITSEELREKFLRFMESKGHKIIPSASLIPENDPAVVKSTVGSFSGISEAEGMIACPFDSKNFRYMARSSLLVQFAMAIPP